jgi:hypothetical protein
MLLHDEIAETTGSPETSLKEDPRREVFRIEAVLKRAHEIQRSRGGLFGYDLDDWLQAEREFAGRDRVDDLQVEKPAHAGLLPWDQERNCETCVGLYD